MKKLASLAVVLVAVFAMCGSVWAFNAAEHLSVAPNGKGDVLIFPQYIAMPGGWQTKLTVINTCDSMSVVAKVVVRSGGWTKELLDFFIFLSPTDVWTGTLDYAGSNVRLYSTDDSIIKDEAGNFATPTDPFNVNLQSVCAGDLPLTGVPGNQLGYVTVVETWNYDGTWNWVRNGVTTTVDFSQPPVQKAAIRDVFNWYNSSNPNVSSIPFAGDVNEVANVLAGSYEISNFSLGWYAANDATVIQNANVFDWTKVKLAQETRLGDSTFRNDYCEFEAALAKNRVAMHYYSANNSYGNVTVHFNTFPTKYTLVSNCQIVAPGVKSEFFLDNGLNQVGGSVSDMHQYIRYGLIWYDLSENTTTTSGFVSPVRPEDSYHFPYELNLTEKIWSITYTEGWANYEYDYNTACTAADTVTAVEFTGAPVIPVTMYYNLAGMALHGAAWNDGYVEVGGAMDYLYKYNWRAYDGVNTIPNFCEAVPATLPVTF
ncbi:MAG: hypothetical protein AB7S75_17850 [Desulfococcaceae bacterium]